MKSFGIIDKDVLSILSPWCILCIIPTENNMYRDVTDSKNLRINLSLIIPKLIITRTRGISELKTFLFAIPLHHPHLFLDRPQLVPVSLWIRDHCDENAKHIYFIIYQFTWFGKGCSSRPVCLIQNLFPNILQACKRVAFATTKTTSFST